jgi:hypothetical protein
MRRLIPFISETFPAVIADLPVELQLISLFVVMPVIAAGIGYGLYRVSRRVAARRAMEVYLESIQDVKKLMVYVSGSGSVGFTNAVARLTRGNPVKQLCIFSHPPIVAVKKGSVRLMGAVTAFAPVQYAMGSHKAAQAARGAEGERYRQAHQAFLDATGGRTTAVEWSVIHVGKGHTSVSCHTEWEGMRSTVLAGAAPQRFAIIVRDSTFEESDLGTDGSELEGRSAGENGAESTISDDIAPAVVRVVNNNITGSGVVIDADGLVLTNAHVVGDSDTVTVRFVNGIEATAKVEERDEDKDVALLYCRGVKGVTPIMRGDSAALSRGDLVAAFGYPANAATEHPVVDMGVATKFILDGDRTLIQSNVAISPGCSGGPLVTLDGRFMGLLTSTHVDPEDQVERTIALSGNDVFDVVEKFKSQKAVTV